MVGRRQLTRRILAALTAALAVSLVAAAPATAAPAPPAPGTTDVRIIAFNDLHGNLEPPAGSSGRVAQPDGTTVDAGGAAFMATHIKQLRAQARNSMVLSAGDDIGASPVISALFHDEPTIALMNQLGVAASAAGNHEFDEGYQELLRIQRGGCHPVDGCQFRPTYEGARHPILSSNITRERPRGFPALLPFTVTNAGGVPVGVIGATVKDLPTLVTSEALRGLRVEEEVGAINRTAAFLQRIGVRSQVVLLHQGDDPGTGPSGPDTCTVAPNGAGTAIARATSPSVDAIFTAHSHQQYICSVPDPAGQPRPLVQGASFGRLLSVVDLRVDNRTRDVVRSATRADNHIVTRTVAPDPAAAALVDEARTKAGPIANRAVGTIAADLLRLAATSGESPLGSVIADGQLAATRSAGAQIAMTNPGGVRTDLLFASSSANEGNGVVTYGEAFAVQPFGNIMQTLTYTGAQLDAVLEQQYQVGRVLQISDTLRYTTSTSAPVGAKVSGITIGGVPVDPAGRYRVSVNNFLAGGGDGFSTLREGTEVTGGPVDLDALIAYLGANPNVAPPATNRITVAP